MKTLLLTLPVFLVLNACSTKDDDTAADDGSFIDGGSSDGGSSDGGSSDGGSSDGGSSDGGSSDGGGSDGGGGSNGGGSGGGGDVMSSDPGCDMASALCYSFDGPLWASQDINGFCDDISADYEAEGAPPMNFLDDGCPSGAASECSGVLMGADAEGNPVSGSDVTLYFYAAVSEADASATCDQAGGNFSTL
jgi:hypothetical protein